MTTTMFEMRNWPPLEPHEVPPNLPSELQALLFPLQQVAAATLVLISEHEMMAALGQEEAFIRKVTATNAAAGLNTINACILDSLIIGLCALFDGRSDHIVFRPILNRLSDPQHVPLFQAWHDTKDRLDAARACARLGRMRKRLNKNPLKASLKRLDDLRDQGIAHISHSPNFSRGWPLVRDITYLVALASNISVTALNLMTVRRIQTKACLADARAIASGVSSSIRPSVIRNTAVLKFLHQY
jgi:hypothetical protein